MKIDEMVPTKSKFLTKDDVGEAGKNLTIHAFESMEVGTGDELEHKFCIVWQQADYKPMVLNKENANRLKVILRTDDTDAMVGQTVNVYNDPMVSYGGKVVGGIRLRPTATRTAAPPARKPAAKPAPAPVDPDDELPDDELPPLESYEDNPPPF
jgi:hypothetical protein